MHDIEAALNQCGVTPSTLAPHARTALDQQGWVVLPAVVEAARLEKLRLAFEAAMQRQRQPAEASRTGTRHVTIDRDADAVFDAIYTEPHVLAAVYHVLQRAFRVLQLGGRDPLPGFGQQGLHTDWLPRAAADPYALVTALWLLDDFTAENGATRLVPASHRDVRPLPKSMAAPASHHPREQTIVARAGSVLVFNGHLLHSGTCNRSAATRRVLQCQFVARDATPAVDPRDDVPARWTPAVRYFLGIGAQAPAGSNLHPKGNDIESDSPR